MQTVHGSRAFLLVAILCYGCAVHRQQVTFGDHRVAKELRTADHLIHTEGFVLYDPASQQYLFEKNADLFFTPASNTKIATLYALLHCLGDSTQTLRYVEHGDSLIFWGVGDPSFLYDSLFRGRSAFELLKRHSGQLVYAPLPDIERFGPGWAWDDYHYGFQVERTTLPLFGNRVTISMLMDEVVVTEPAFFKSFLSVNRELAEPVRRSPDVNAFEINPALMSGPQIRVSVPVLCSPYQTMELLSDTLGRPVSIDYGFRHPQSGYNVIRGEPVDSLYKRLMQESDNFFAEQLLLQCTMLSNGDTNVRAMIDQVLGGLLVDVREGFRWYDASGVSRYNLMTPRTSIRLLEKLMQENGLEYIKKIFPAGGISGTISNHYGGEVAPYVYAKSGTMKNNYCLSGYLITSEGRLLIFSSMHSNFAGDPDRIKDDIERILNFIYRTF